MSKQCPNFSCQQECPKVYQCDDCGFMFCKWCGEYAFVRGGPIRAHGCPNPKCESSWGGGQTIVSQDEDSPGDDRSSSSSDDDDDLSSEYSTSSDDPPYSSDDSSYSSDYSSSSYGSSEGSSKSSGSGLFWIIVFVVCLLIGAFLNAQNHDRQRTTANTSMPSQSTPARPPQSPPVYLFQNTLPGTYNMGQNQSQAQSNRLEAENHGLTSSSEESSVPTPPPADPPTVRCILSTGVEILISGPECHERPGTIYTEQPLLW
jgi:hypothetical protein